MREIVTKDNCKIAGRHLIKDGICYLEFSAGYIEFAFTGRNLSFTILSDYSKDDILTGYAAVYINGEFYKKLKLDKEKAEYRILEYENTATVVVRLVRLTETNFGKLGVLDIIHDGSINKTPDKKLKIEFIGNSITCGYGVEAEGPTVPFSTSTENPVKAYAVMTADELDADYELICWSGNGLLTHWIPPEKDEPDDTFPLIQDVYRNLNVAGYRFEKLDKVIPYDFKSFTPDIVVINIGTNDASYTRNDSSRVECFGKVFENFILEIAEKRPNASIIAALGVMNGELSEIENQIMNKLSKKGHKTYFINQQLQLPEDGLGADYHPTEVTHRKCAKQLVDFIKENILL